MKEAAGRIVVPTVVEVAVVGNLTVVGRIAVPSLHCYWVFSPVRATDFPAADAVHVAHVHKLPRPLQSPRSPSLPICSYSKAGPLLPHFTITSGRLRTVSKL